MRLRRVGAALTVLVAMTAVSGCTPGGEGGPTPSSPVISPDVALTPGCVSWAEPPATGEVSVYKAWLEWDPDFPEIARWSIILHNSSDVRAVDVRVVPTFTRDGVDVTDELDRNDLRDFPGEGRVEPRENADYSFPFNAPESWNRDAELTATVEVGRWCVPVGTST